jgi:hypothetical protein
VSKCYQIITISPCLINNYLLTFSHSKFRVLFKSTYMFPYSFSVQKYCSAFLIFLNLIHYRDLILKW